MESLNLSQQIEMQTYTENVYDLYANFNRIYPVEKWKKYGFYTDDYLHRINRHWLSFPPQSRYIHYILGLLYLIFMVVGLSGNSIVVLLFNRHKSLRSPANNLVINLAVSDFLMMTKTVIFIYNSILEGPALGDLACQLYGFVGGLTGTVSIITLAAISLDRFYVINYPLKMEFTAQRVKIYIILTWIYGAIFSLIPAFDMGFGTYVPEGYLTSCSFDYLSDDPSVRGFIFTFFCAAWVVPFLIISFCYISILKVAVFKREKISADKLSQDSKRHTKEDERKTEIKITMTVLFIVSLWFLSWTPYAVVALLGVVGRKDLIAPFTSMVPALFCKTSSCINPFIYALSNPKFQEQVNLPCIKKTSKSKTITLALKTQSFRSQLNESASLTNEDDDVEISASPSEVIEISLKDVNCETDTLQETSNIDSSAESGRLNKMARNARRFKTNDGKVFSIRGKKVPFLCKAILRPSFSNRSNSVRNLARRWTLRTRRRTLPVDLRK